MTAVDIDAYLDRVGVARDEVDEPSLAALRRLHRAHVDAIPFASVLSALGRVPQLDLETLQTRLVAEGRGGYCMEHVKLLAAVLEALGFRPQVRLAGVGELDRPPSHLTVLARPADDERRWMADVGFGVGVLGPLPVPSSPGEGEPRRHGCWEHRVDVDEAGRLVLHEVTRDGWQMRHGAEDRDVTAAEIDAGNDSAARHPDSPFSGKLVAMRTTDERRERLVGTKLVRTEGLKPSTAEELEPEAALEALVERFGVTVDPSERDALVALLAEQAP